MKMKPYFIYIDRSEVETHFGFVLANRSPYIIVESELDFQDIKYEFNLDKIAKGITVIKISNEDYNKFFSREIQDSNFQWRVRDDAPTKHSLEPIDLFNSVLEEVPLENNSNPQIPSLDERLSAIEAALMGVL